MTKNVIQFCHFVAERHHPKRWPSFKVQGSRCVCVCVNFLITSFLTCVEVGSIVI